MAELAPPLAVFLREYLPRDRGASRHTVASYATSFRLLVVFAARLHGVRPSELQIVHLDTKTLLAFLDDLEKDRLNGVQTRNVRLAAIKSFFRYLEFRHPEYLDLAAQVRTLPKKKCELSAVEHLSHAEVQALLDAPARDTVTGLRDRAMLMLTYNAGLRVSELVGLALQDLERPSLGSIRVTGKGRRQRVLPLWKQTRATLSDWLSARPGTVDLHLFLNSSGNGLTRRGFAKRLAVYVKAAALAVPSIGDKVVTPHALRHSCALHTLKGEAKSRRRLSGTVLKEAGKALGENEGLPSPHALAFYADRLAEDGRQELADLIDDMQYRDGIRREVVSHMIFSFSGNDPEKLLRKRLAKYKGKFEQMYVGLHVNGHGEFIESVFERVDGHGHA